MTTIHDKEFGDITVRRSMRASAVKISVAPSGALQASLPSYAPIFMLRQLIKSSLTQLRKMLEKQAPIYKLENGMQIGQNHTLIIGKAKHTTIRLAGSHIAVGLSESDSIQDAHIERLVRDKIIEALRVEAKSYLPKRLMSFAQKLDYTYERVRFSHASTRWGSCSSSGTISLNIALMALPSDLIDYVLIHELSHTKQMNHSQKFWQLVEQADPSYKLHRSMLKKHSPTI